MNNEIVVLSLFDGMSCGQQALERVGIIPKKYYASEIDKYAITVTMANYPNTIQLGSVTDVDISKLEPISLLIGGSPCQSFSFAGKRNGMSTKDSIEILELEHYLELKSQNFEFEGQSYLFWEYMRVLTDIRKYNPDVKFLLENVIMGEKWQKVLTKAIGINPIEINSALVSAQNRRRLFWTNISAEPDGLFGDLACKIPQPKDRGILLKDILEKDVPEKYFLSDKMIDVISKHGAIDNLDNDKSNCILTSYHKMGGRDQQYIDESFKGLDVNSKSRTIRQGGKGTATDKHNWDLIRVQSQKDRLIERTGVDIENEKEPIILDVYNKKLKDDYKVPTLTDPIHNNIRLVVPNVTGGDYRHDEGFRWRENGKSPTLTARGRNTDSKDYTGQPLLKINDIVAMRGRPNEDGYEQQIESNGTEKSNTLTSVQKDNLVRERELIIHNVPEMVSVRKYEVDVKKLQECLKSHKKYNNKKIADLLEVPKTMVDHWFRTDDYFSIPDKDIWIKLKNLLEIKTDEFDQSIMTFEEKEGVFEKANRVYDEEGLAPTLTSSSADEKVLVRELNQNQMSKLNLNVDTDKSNCLTLAQGRAGSSSEYMDAVSKIAKITSRIRRLTPVECERLQCVKDNYTAHVSDTQRYRMLGNGWTISVIEHIFNYLPKDWK
jgi:site-specific DNA-cytosine methylase